MALVYVTGSAGSGKSAVLRELRARGYTALGVDEDGFAEWVRRDTGVVDRFPHDDESLDFNTWYADCEWMLSINRISILKQDDTSPVFLCGVAAGEKAAWHLFDVVVGLVADAETIKQRIEERTDNQFGKSPAEMQEILTWHAAMPAEAYHALGAVTVDATQPLTAVVDAVIAAATQSPALPA